MAAIHDGVTRGCQRSAMVWCMLAADAIVRFHDLHRDCWAFHDVRLGGVPPDYLATLIEISRVLTGKPCDRRDVARLLFRLVTADPLLVETVTRLLIAAPPLALAAQPFAATTFMIEAVDHLDSLTHDQLLIAHDLAATWHDGPATLAAEARIRSPG